MFFGTRNELLGGGEGRGRGGKGELEEDIGT